VVNGRAARKSLEKVCIVRREENERKVEVDVQRIEIKENSNETEGARILEFYYGYLKHQDTNLVAVAWTPLPCHT